MNEEAELHPDGVEINLAKNFVHFMCRHGGLPAQTVLEVGCGQGRAAAFTWQKAGALLLTDIDQEATRTLSERMEGKANIRVGCMPSSEVKGTFDVVYYFLSLHHISDLAGELAQAHRLLTDGGRLFICEYNANPLHPLHRYDPVPHEGITTDCLNSILVSLGFAVLVTQNISTLTRQTDGQRVDYTIYAIGAQKDFRGEAQEDTPL